MAPSGEKDNKKLLEGISAALESTACLERFTEADSHYRNVYRMLMLGQRQTQELLNLNATGWNSDKAWTLQVFNITEVQIRFTNSGMHTAHFEFFLRR